MWNFDDMCILCGNQVQFSHSHENDVLFYFTAIYKLGHTICSFVRENISKFYISFTEYVAHTTCDGSGTTWNRLKNGFKAS